MTLTTAEDSFEQQLSTNENEWIGVNAGEEELWGWTYDGKRTGSVQFTPDELLAFGQRCCELARKAGASDGD